MPTVGGIARTLNRRPAPGVVVIVLALVGAFLVSRGCQRNYVRVTKDQAVFIGQKEIDFQPEGHTVRMILRGIPPKRKWAVSYWIRGNPQEGSYRKLTVVVVDANTGKIEEINVEKG